MSKLLQFLGLSENLADPPQELPFFSMRQLKFDEISQKPPSLSHTTPEISETNASLRPSSYLIKKIIQKPAFCKYSSPLKLACKKPLALSQSKSFTPNMHWKLQSGPLDHKNRSYSSLEVGQTKENNLESLAFVDENELLAEDNNFCEKAAQPYNFIAKIDFAELLSRKSADIVVLDCRYAFEFAGGHIKSAINLENNPFKLLEIFFFREKVAETPEEMKEKTPKLASPTKELAEKLDFLDFCGEDAAAISKKMLVFHCEFSKCRGPKLYNLLRSFDREINFKNYPKLSYPQIFLLEGGYSEFYESFPELCEGTYRKMRDKSFNFEYIRQKVEIFIEFSRVFR